MLIRSAFRHNSAPLFSLIVALLFAFGCTHPVRMPAIAVTPTTKAPPPATSEAARARPAAVVTNGQNQERDTDGDGIPDAVEIARGTDPNDYYNGESPNVESLVGLNGELGPDNSIGVRVMDKRGKPLVNAPTTFRANVGQQRYAARPGTPWAEARDEIEVRTDKNGVAKAYVIAPPSP